MVLIKCHVYTTEHWRENSSCSTIEIAKCGT